MEQIGSRLQQLRVGQDLNQTQMVDRLAAYGLRWSQATLSKVEMGLRPLRVAELPAIALALGVDQQHLLVSEDAFSGVLDRVRVSKDATNGAEAAAIDALTEATLALVDEQRTANLIALFGEGFAGMGLDYTELVAQIRERLDLA